MKSILSPPPEVMLSVTEVDLMLASTMQGATVDTGGPSALVSGIRRFCKPVCPVAPENSVTARLFLLLVPPGRPKS